MMSPKIKNKEPKEKTKKPFDKKKWRTKKYSKKQKCKHKFIVMYLINYNKIDGLFFLNFV